MWFQSTVMLSWLWHAFRKGIVSWWNGVLLASHLKHTFFLPPANTHSVPFQGYRCWSHLCLSFPFFSYLSRWRVVLFLFLIYLLLPNSTVIISIQLFCSSCLEWGSSWLWCASDSGSHHWNNLHNAAGRVFLKWPKLESLSVGYHCGACLFSFTHSLFS